MKTALQSFCYLFYENRIVESRIRSKIMTSNNYVPEWEINGWITHTIRLHTKTYDIYEITITDFGYDMLELYKL